jgi:uncharacterized protein (UPF0548 family)
MPESDTFRDRARRAHDKRADELRALRDLAPNFESFELPRVKRDPWHMDDYRRDLPSEAPGEPTANGSFESARRLLNDYEFADAKRVRASYDEEAPLLDRDMLLEIRYLLLRVRVGVRVTQIFDELRDVDGHPVRIWGWAYQTLEGHLERGQMDYQLWKWLETGAVEFRIHAVSEMAEVRNPLLYLGFRLVGRREQIRFARRCGERMEELVRRSIQDGPRAEPRPRQVHGVRVSPSE